MWARIITENEIHAAFKDGILKVIIDKPQPKKIEDGKTIIPIEGLIHIHQGFYFIDYKKNAGKIPAQQISARQAEEAAGLFAR